MGLVADGSPELMPAGSASRAAAGQDSSIEMVGLSLEVLSCNQLDHMASVGEISSPDHTQQIRQIQVFTIVWMLVEVVVSLFSAWRARSPALFAFGGDSVIELASAMVVLWRFRPAFACETKEDRAARIAGALLFVLAACVAVGQP